MATWSRPSVPARLLTAAQVPLVGRRSELATLEDAWSAVTGGTRQAIFVGGEPGAGKTRLMAEAARVLADHDAAVLMGTCTADYSLPYQPFVEMLDHLLAHVPPGDVDGALAAVAPDLARISPQVARHRPDVAPGEDAHGDPRRDLFDAVAALLRSLASERPVVLVLDDLQWAQAPTLALLSHVIATVGEGPLLVLAGFRTTALERNDDLTAAIADLYRLEGVRRIDLAGLDTDDIAEYLQRDAGASPTAAQRSAPVLRDQTGGNPFFLRELWRELRQRGGLPALRAGAVRTPGSVGDTLERRLAGMTAGGRRVLEAAAVMGDVFEVATLTATGEAEPGEVLAAVDAAAAIGLVEPAADGTGTCAFIHALSRQAVLDRLAPSRLAALHARVARALERRRAEPQVVPRLAHHYLRCHILGYGAEAVRCAAEAARLAERSLAFEDAASWFEKAAGLPDVDDGERVDLLFAAATNHLRSGGFARARAIYERLATSGSPDRRLAAALGFEDASWRPGIPGARAADLLTEALEVTALPADDPRYIGALASLGRALTFAGATHRARELGRRAIDLARRHGDDALVAHAELASLWPGMVLDRAEVQLARSTELAERARAVDSHDMRGAACYFRAVAAYTLGRPRDLDTAVSDYVHATDASGHQPFFAYLAGCLEQGRTFRRGDFEGAERQAEHLVEVGQAFGSDDVEGPYGLQMFMVQRETGRLESVRPLISGEEPVRGHWVPGLLALYTELGLEQGMRRTLRHVLDSFGEERRVSAQWPTELAFATEAALALRDADATAALEPHLARYAGMNLVGGEFGASFGAADRFLARIASLRGDDEAAEQHFRAALAMDETMGSPVHTAETLLHHGLHLLARGEGDRAWALLERARETAGRIGQERVLRRIPTRRAGGGPCGLTDREMQVLRLLAEGLSNQEIGARLHISANTAANHVRRILMKTGAANRTQAARYAASDLP